MRTSARLLPVALVAAIVLAAAVGSASARNLSFSSQTIRTGMFLRLEALGVLTSCPVTLEGSFHSRTIAKAREALIGAITAARTNKLRCLTATRTLMLAEPDSAERETLPWSLHYETFAGTLPRITGLRIAVVGMGIRVVGGCEYLSTVENPAYLLTTVAAGRIESIAFLEEVQINRPRESMCFPPEASLSGSEVLTVLGATTSVTVRLI